MNLKSIGIGILDTIFPIRCFGCDAPDTNLCERCLTLFPRRLRQRCPACFSKTTPHGETCFECCGKSALDGLFAATSYRSPIVAAAIHTYKYRFIPAFAQPLGSWLAECIIESGLPLPDALLPVPLHKRRLRFRGFNQSVLLAGVLADTLTPGLVTPVYTDALLRARSTKPQMKTKTREERLNNVHDAFMLNQKYKPLLRGASVWLIDDVATTGATLKECAQTLKTAGVKNVFGVVLAR